MNLMLFRRISFTICENDRHVILDQIFPQRCYSTGFRFPHFSFPYVKHLQDVLTNC